MKIIQLKQKITLKQEDCLGKHDVKNFNLGYIVTEDLDFYEKLKKDYCEETISRYRSILL